MEIRTKARRLAAEYGLDLIIIDYLQLMQGGERRSENRVQEISYISRALKGLARELSVPVIALSQLSRAVEAREHKMPVLSDLRESGSIEQDADIVMFIYREDMYDENTERGQSPTFSSPSIATAPPAWCSSTLTRARPASLMRRPPRSKTTFPSKAPTGERIPGVCGGQNPSDAIARPFFSELLPQADDLDELKVTLYLLWYIAHMRGYPRYLTLRELEAETRRAGRAGRRLG